MQTATKKGGYSFAWGEKNFPPNKNKLSERSERGELVSPNLIRAERENYGACNNESVSDEELRSVRSETLSLWVQYIHCERGASFECTTFIKSPCVTQGIL